MKRLWVCLMLALVGLFCGVAVSMLNGAFEARHCGEDCASAALGSLLAWAGAGVVVFLVLGLVLWPRTRKTFKSLVWVALLLASASTLPSLGIYGYELHSRYWKDEWSRHIPNSDYSLMVIAANSIEVTTAGAESKIQIKHWERCALGSIDCEKKPRSLEAICLGSGKVVTIEESKWPVFRRIPDEDLQGLNDRPGDMQLCKVR